ncbi:unnamed protein product [Echinostoma caproni]|uniref:H15 domain-containing protein n=1 Tax=Echinostoma caproni TaxID=27848 RepID=A0A183B8R3_9TREM|nr:unnamed protein product [Echinostoma caproni]
MSVPAAAPAKKPKTAKPKAPASHPSIIGMVKTAVTAAKDRKGTSLSTIKRYIAVNYKADVDRLGPHMRRGMVHAVRKGVLVRVGNKGKGASGSFKLDEKKAAKHKPKAMTKPKAPKVNQTATPKKPTVAKKPGKPTAKTPTKPNGVKAKKATPKKPKISLLLFVLQALIHFFVRFMGLGVHTSKCGIFSTRSEPSVQRMLIDRDFIEYTPSYVYTDSTYIPNG